MATPDRIHVAVGDYHLPGRDGERIVAATPFGVATGLIDVVSRADATVLLEEAMAPPVAFFVASSKRGDFVTSGGRDRPVEPLRVYLAVPDVIRTSPNGFGKPGESAWRLVVRVAVPDNPHLQIRQGEPPAGWQNLPDAGMTDLLTWDHVRWLERVCAPLPIFEAPGIPHGVEGRDTVMMTTSVQR